jgi:hypothetical protein
MRWIRVRVFHVCFIFSLRCTMQFCLSFPFSARYKKKHARILTWWREQSIRVISPTIHLGTFSKTLILVLNTTWWALWSGIFKFLIAQTVYPKIQKYWSFPSTRSFMRLYWNETTSIAFCRTETIPVRSWRTFVEFRTNLNQNSITGFLLLGMRRFFVREELFRQYTTKQRSSYVFADSFLKDRKMSLYFMKDIVV